MLKGFFSYSSTAFIWGSTRVVQLRDGGEVPCPGEGLGRLPQIFICQHHAAAAGSLAVIFLGASVQAQGIACECRCCSPCSHTLLLPCPCLLPPPVAHPGTSSHFQSHTRLGLASPSPRLLPPKLLTLHLPWKAHVTATYPGQWVSVLRQRYALSGK